MYRKIAITEITIQLKVRYNECDSMGVVHNSVYPIWFEIGRTELLRQNGSSYKELEDIELFLVVSELHIKYKRSAKYDDNLSLRIKVGSVTNVRVKHLYEVIRENVVITSGSTVIACVDRDGTVRPIPEEMRW
ncbi:MAG: thioesterase family protein [Phycisphaerales bacterium]|nr:thioesterase family protein [Phycisphaerales bacterium]